MQKNLNNTSHARYDDATALMIFHPLRYERMMTRWPVFPLRQIISQYCLSTDQQKRQSR